MATNARDLGALTEAVAAEIRSIMGVRNMNQADLSRATGIHKATVSSMLNVKSAIDMEQVGKIADALEMDPDELMAGAFVRYRQLLGKRDKQADERVVGPLVTSRGSVLARATEEERKGIAEHMKRRQVREPQLPNPDQ